MREDNFEEDNFGEELYEEYLYFEYKDKYESVKEQLVEKEKEIEILNNNWNELENYIKVELKNVIPMWTLETHYSFGESTIYDYILNKMKELKGNNKE